MPWFYNSYSGELTHASGVDALAYEAAIHTGTGWHELKIADSATEQQAAAEAVKEVPGGTKPTTSVAQGVGNAAVNNPVTNAIPGLSQVGDFFSALTQANTWIRVAKVVFGGVLLVIGIAHITGAGNAVASAARKVPVPI